MYYYCRYYIRSLNNCVTCLIPIVIPAVNGISFNGAWRMTHFSCNARVCYLGMVTALEWNG